VDVPGNRLVVGKGSAYDLFLTREIESAQIVRAPTSPTVVKVFLEGGYEVAAGVRQQLESDASKTPGYRLLPGRFMVINQAMGLPKNRGHAASRLLSSFVEEMKASGFIGDAMKRHGIKGASVAPYIGDREPG
jgi:polar amino acid transport system substrate-binding protein